MSQAHKSVVLIACGGFGVNMLLKTLDGPVYNDMADSVDLRVIDTTPANLKLSAGHKFDERINKHLIPNAKGSGKNRGEHHPEIVAMVNDLVNNGMGIGSTLVVFISSATGGTGPTIAGEGHQILTDRGVNCISLILGTDGSVQDLENADKHIRTLQNKSGKGTKDYTIFYDTNRQADGTVSMKQTDKVFLSTIDDLMLIGHPENSEIDPTDVSSWLNPPALKGQPGKVRVLSLVSRRLDQDVPDDEVPISTLSLLNERGMDPLIIPGVLYNTHGYLGDGIQFQNGIEEVQFQTLAGKSVKLVNALKAKITEYKKIAAEAAEKAAGDSFKAHESDMVSEEGTLL